jgi:hypothetical protein
MVGAVIRGYAASVCPSKALERDPWATGAGVSMLRERRRGMVWVIQVRLKNFAAGGVRVAVAGLDE